MISSSPASRRAWLVVAAWLGVVSVVGYTEISLLVPVGLRGPVVAAGIAGPFLLYLMHRPTRALLDRVPDAAVVATHSWRVAAGFGFLFAADRLPPVFVRNAGYGDLLVAALVPAVLVLPERRGLYLGFHLVGLADFVLAVGTGLYFTASADPLMDHLFRFPLVLVPWFGVGLSGASHLIVLHRLLRPARPPAA